MDVGSRYIYGQNRPRTGPRMIFGSSQGWGLFYGRLDSGVREYPSIVAKLLKNWSTGWIFGAACVVVRQIPGTKRGLGPSLAEKRPKVDPFRDRLDPESTLKPLKGRLDCLIDSFWLIGFLVCFVVGPGGFREGLGSPRNPDGRIWGPGQKPKNPYLLQ